MILLNGEVQNQIYIDEGLSYGYGVFETIKVTDEIPIFLDEHMARLTNSAIKLNIGKINIEPLKKNIDMLINLDKPRAIKVSILKSKGGYDEIVSSRSYNYSKSLYDNGYKLMVTDYLRNEFSRVVYHKTNNYLENILAFREIKSAGYDEVLFLNTGGFVAEGAISNVFFIENKTLYTPSIDCGILNGIIRDKVIEIAKENGIQCIETRLSKDQITGYDSAFITNSLMGIMPVSFIDNYELKVDTALTKMISEKLARKERDSYRDIRQNNRSD